MFANNGYAYQSIKQANEFVITHYGIDDGLPTETVTDIEITDDGYLFVASVSGLLRFDGFRFKNFSVSNQSGFTTDRISKIYDMSPGSILVQDQNNMLFKLKNGKAIPLVDPVNNEPIKAVAVKEMGSKSFVATDENFIYKIESDTVIILGSAFKNYSIWDIEIIDSLIYTLNTDGIYLSDEEETKKLNIPRIYRPDLTNHARLIKLDDHLRITGKGGSACYNLRIKKWCKQHGLSSKNNEEFLHIKKTSDEEYLISTSKGFMIQGKSGTDKFGKSEKGLMYESIFETKYGTILVADDGVWLGSKKLFEPRTNIIDADIDSHQNIWVSTSNDGLYHIKKNYFNNFSSNILTNSYAIEKDRYGRMWAGTFDNGVFTWDKTENTQIEAGNSALPNNTVRMISPLADSSLLVSLWGHPPVIISEKNISALNELWPLFGKGTNVVEAFYEGENGRWWFGSIDGLYIKQGSAFSTYFDKNGKTIKHITRIIKSPYNSDLIFCTVNDGLVLLRDQRFYFLSNRLTEPSKHIRDVYISKKDTLWAASYNGGLQRYLIGESITSPEIVELGKKEGVKAAGYHRIVADTAGYLWISSNKGLLRVSEVGLNYSADNKTLMTELIWYNDKDGIINREFNGGTQSTGFYDKEEDLIWFSNVSGIVSFNPYDLEFSKTEKHTFNVYISEDVMIKKTGNGFVAHLPAKRRDVKVEFSHVSLSNNLTDRIWYKIDEKGSWQRPDESGVLHLENLKAGTAKIFLSTDPQKIIASVLELEVKPYFYENRFLQLIIGLFFISVCILVYRKRFVNEEFTGVDRMSSGNKELLEGIEPLEKRDLFREYIDMNYSDKRLSTQMLAEEFKISRSSLYRSWDKNNDESILDYIQKVRLQKAKKLLVSTELSISDIAEKTGFSSQSYFTKVFKKQNGISPSNYKDFQS